MPELEMASQAEMPPGCSFLDSAAQFHCVMCYLLNVSFNLHAFLVHGTTSLVISLLPAPSLIKPAPPLDSKGTCEVPARPCYARSRPPSRT